MVSKSAQLVIDRTVAFIIAILVIVLVAGIFFALNPNFLYKLFPNFHTPSDTGDEIIEGGDILTKACKDDAEMIGTTTGTGVELPISMFVDGKNKDTALFYKFIAEGKGEIILKSGYLLGIGDKVLGTVESKTISIKSEYLNAMNELYLENLFADKPIALDSKDLGILDGASLAGGRFFCRPKGSQISSSYVSADFSTEINLNDLVSSGSLFSSFSSRFKKEGDKVRIDLSPFILAKDNQFYYLEKKENFFKVYLNRPWKTDCLIGAIAKDGYLYQLNDWRSVTSFRSTDPIFTCGVDPRVNNDYAGFYPNPSLINTNLAFTRVEGKYSIQSEKFVKTNIHMDFDLLKNMYASPFGVESPIVVEPYYPSSGSGNNIVSSASSP